MGWTYPYGATLKSLIAERSTSWENEKVKSECLKKCFRGNPAFSGTLWSVWEQTNKITGEKSRFILCDLLECKGGEWGYKDLSEGMHPYTYTCPISYLSLVPDNSPDTNEDWRKYVRERYEKKKKARQELNAWKKKAYA